MTLCIRCKQNPVKRTQLCGECVKVVTLELKEKKAAKGQSEANNAKSP